jgi:hypothetical protein
LPGFVGNALANGFAVGAGECWLVAMGGAEFCDAGTALAIGAAEVRSCELTAGAAPSVAEWLVPVEADCEREQAKVRTIDSVSR